MNRRVWHLVWIFPVAGLVGWSLLQQARRAETVGQQVETILRQGAMSGRLRGAMPMAEFSLVAGGEKMAVHRRGGGIDGSETWVGEGFELIKAGGGGVGYFKEQLENEEAGKAVENALRKAGYVFIKPRELVEAAREELRKLTDEELANAFVRADVATLEQAQNGDVAAGVALLLLAWEPSGAVGWMTSAAGGEVFLFQTANLQADEGEQRAILVRMGADGKEQWHGVVRVKKGTGMMEMVSRGVEAMERTTDGSDSATN